MDSSSLRQKVLSFLKMGPEERAKIFADAAAIKQKEKDKQLAAKEFLALSEQSDYNINREMQEIRKKRILQNFDKREVTGDYRSPANTNSKPEGY